MITHNNVNNNLFSKGENVMKKMKKLLAVLLTLAMVMGLGMTSFAAKDSTTPYEADITITGLAEGDTTTLNLYAIVTLNDAENAWEVVNWAAPFIDVTGANYEITNAAGLGAAAANQAVTEQKTVNTTTVTFADKEVGAYLILAAGQKQAYSPMVVNTYANDETYMTAIDKEATAKTSGSYVVNKEAEEGDRFVARGEEVEFTITTIYPNFLVADSAENSFKVIDTPTGLDITEVVSVKFGEVSVTNYTTSEADGKFIIDLTNTIGTANEHVGKVVTIKYKAIVTSDEGYSNTANVYRNDVSLGSEGGESGVSANITITKKAFGTNEVLNGAEFSVYEGTKEAHGAALEFVKISDGVYKLALDSEDGTTTLVATNGTLQIKGLDAGNYWFEETKAPAGYSINTDGVVVAITDAENDDVENLQLAYTGELIDTKLSALPATGGIGTTIFTIGGCVIMVAAAYMFFVSRRKED